MPRTFQPAPAELSERLHQLGTRLKLARQNSQWSATHFAESLGVSRDTLHRMEQGQESIALGTYARALVLLGLDRNLDELGKPTA